MDNRTACLILNLLPGIGPVRVRQLVSVFGEPAALFRAGRDELARVHGIGPNLADVLCNWREQCDPDAELKLIAQAGVELVTSEDAGYPAPLKELHDPPLCLYLRGNPEALTGLQAAIAVVGSRRTSSYGVRMAENLAAAAAMAGWTVVSGLARGIDTAAHAATVDAGGRTIAVLGSGLAHIYPQDNLGLARRIVEGGGALVSEFPMRFPPDKRTFPMRNRIIAGLSRGTLVVEAGDKSGALLTASAALDLGRPVFAVPGRVDTPQSRGCHALIRDGAVLTESFADVLDEFVLLPGLTRNIPAAGAGKKSVSYDTIAEKAAENLHLSDAERKILAFLTAGEAAIDDLLAGLQEPAPAVLGALVTLEMRRLVRQLPGKRVVRLKPGSVAAG